MLRSISLRAPDKVKARMLDLGQPTSSLCPHNRPMFTRRFKIVFARICIALLCMQAAVAAYACPAFVADIEAAQARSTHHGHHAPAAKDACDQHPSDSVPGKTMCHQHYAGDQSVGSGSLGSASAAPALPLAVVDTLEPAMPAASRVLPILLQRSTAPPLSIRFLVLRI